MRVQPPGLQIRVVVLLTAWLVGVWGHVAAFEKQGYQLEALLVLRSAMAGARRLTVG